MLGGLYFAGAGQAIDYQIKKRKAEAANLTGRSFSSIVNNSRHLIEDNEQGEERRAPAHVARLHSAKYIKCDPMMKELFFPLFTYGRRFGFCSTTSLGGLTAAGGFNGNNDVQSLHKAAGCHRGISLFTLRSQVISAGSVNKLEPVLKIVGSTEFGNQGLNPILSPYLRFNNGPPLITSTTTTSYDQGNSGGMVDTTIATGSSQGVKAPTVTDAAPPAATGLNNPADFNKNNIRVSEVGDIHAIENKAVLGGPFKTNFWTSFSSYSAQPTDSTGIAQTAGTDTLPWNGHGEIVRSDGTYYENLKNTTIRIADGYLELDISNGKSSPAFIEVVIHAHRKHSSDVGTQELLDAIFNAVQYQQSDRPTSSYYVNTTLNQQQPGGWQAFWDPTYPLFGVKAQHKKDVDSIATEVHRSNHMLSAGQTKCVKIYLGNLFYDLGGKFQNGSTSGGTMGFSANGIGVGGLQIAVGHSGVKMLTAPTRGTADSAPNFSILPSVAGEIDNKYVHGVGYWVGKQFCPSEIVVEGNYVEKFYPSYVVDKERRMWVDKPMPAPHVHDSAENTQRLLPAGQPITDVIGTVQATAPVPADIQSQVRHNI